MLYYLLKSIVALGIRLYYGKIKVLNRQHLEGNQATIYIANHPNTLMDAWLIGFVSKRPVYFMAKATLFSSPLRKKIMKSLNMIPINRQGEGRTDGVANQDSFEACYRLLEEGKCLLIFPEGTSHLERHLRELKSGAARIAMETEARNDNNLQLRVVPIGLNYMQADRFRSSVVVNVGSPIQVAEYIPEDPKQTREAVKRLTELFRMRLEQVLVNSPEKEEEKLTEKLFHIFDSHYLKNEGKGVEGELKFMKKIRDRLAELKITQAWKIEQIEELQENITWKLERYALRADFLDRRLRVRMFLRQLFFSVLGLLIALPVFIYGLIHNIVPYKVTDVLVPKITKEIEYYAPIAVLIGLVFYPLIYVSFLLTVNLFVDFTFWDKVIYFCSMPLAGLASYYMYQYLKHISFKWRLVLLWFNDKEVLLTLTAERERLRTLLFEE